MLPEDYFIEFEGSYYLCLTPTSNNDHWLFGNDFLRGYYSTHDHANNKFGFVPHTGSSKVALTAGTTPETEISIYKPTWYYWVSGALILAVALYLMIRWLRKKPGPTTDELIDEDGIYRESVDDTAILDDLDLPDEFNLFKAVKMIDKATIVSLQRKISNI